MIKVGGTLYVFDINHRVYPDKRGGPSYVGHFLPHVITGETAHSWLLEPYGRTVKVNKKTMLSTNGNYGALKWFTEEGKALNIWVHDNKMAIAGRVTACTDAHKLKRIKVILDEEESA